MLAIFGVGNLAGKIVDPAGNVSVENFVGQIIDQASNFKGWNYFWSNS